MSVAVFLVRTWCTSQFCPCLSFLLVVKASTSCCWQTWKKKVQRVQTMIYTSAVVFVPYLDVEKRFLQHSIMAQHHHGPARLFLFKNTLAYPEKCCFWTVYIIHAKSQLFHYLHTICILEKNCITQNCVFGSNRIKRFGWDKSFWTKHCRQRCRFQPVCAAATNLCAINL